MTDDNVAWIRREGVLGPPEGGFTGPGFPQDGKWYFDTDTQSWVPTEGPVVAPGERTVTPDEVREQILNYRQQEPYIDPTGRFVHPQTTARTGMMPFEAFMHSWVGVVEAGSHWLEQNRLSPQEITDSLWDNAMNEVVAGETVDELIARKQREMRSVARRKRMEALPVYKQVVRAKRRIEVLIVRTKRKLEAMIAVMERFNALDPDAQREAVQDVRERYRNAASQAVQSWRRAHASWKERKRG